jgi:hypothetical protein
MKPILKHISRGLLPGLLLFASAAWAEFHTYKIDQLYSNADRSVQFLVMHESLGMDGENLWLGHTLLARSGDVTRSFVFTRNLPGGTCDGYGCQSAQTANSRVLIATQGFASLGILTPDFVVPNGFFATDGVTVTYGEGMDQVTFPPIPTDGTHAITRAGTIIPNLATNFAGQSASVSGAPDLNFTGLWYKAPADSESGWGINFSHQGDTIFASWFTYDASGKGWWLVMTANSTGANTFSGTLLQATGPAFDAVPFPPLGSPGGIMGSSVGTGTLTFTDANNGAFTYTVNGISQAKAITRQAFGPLPTCVFSASNNLATTANYTALWWAAPAGSESGWGINFTHQGNTIFASWFTFDHDHTPMWLVVTATNSGNGTYTGTLFRLTGPPFNAVPFPPIGSPGGAMPTPVGTATFTFSDGNNAQFAYTVNGVSQTKAITRQVFTPPGTVCQ